METRTLSNIKRKRKQQQTEIWNYKNSKCSDKLRLSDLVFDNVYLFKKDMSNYLPMLYKGLVNIYPEVQNLDVKNNDSTTILNAIIKFLDDTFYLYDINFIETEKGKKTIHIYKKLEVREYSVWFFFTKNILKLKYKSPKIYEILLSFINTIPFSEIEKSSDILGYYAEFAKYEYENMLEFTKDYDKETIIELRTALKGVKKTINALEYHKNSNWIELLKIYYPRKDKYKAVKELLLKAQNIDFNIPFKVTEQTIYNQINEEERPIIFNDLFTTLYDDDTLTNDYIIQSIDSNVNEFGKIPPLDEIIIDHNGNITHDFSIKQKSIDDLTEFIHTFNETLNAL